MRRVLSLLLIAILIFPAAPVSAQDTTPNATLGERFRNMDAEVESFLSLNAATSHGLVLEQKTATTDESTKVSRVRAILLSLEPGTKIDIVLRDGQTVQGRLVEVTDDAFCLNVEIDRKRHVRRDYGFAQLKSLEYTGSPEKVHQIPLGKRIEVVLLDGEKVRGRLSKATEQGFTLSLGKDTNRKFTFDEVLSVRKLGMPGWQKGLIVGGAVFAGMFLLYVDALNIYG